MSRPIEIFLDVETDWSRDLTVVGFRSSVTGLVQIVGRDIKARRLVAELPPHGCLYTYNGHCFDLPVIRKALGLNLRAQYESRDLRFICARHGLNGGQKRIERHIGFRRGLPGVDGWEAMDLWEQYQDGDGGALETLLHYNKEDLDGLSVIKRHLSGRGLLVDH